MIMLLPLLSSKGAVPIIGGWTNCPASCIDSCAPPLGPAKTSWGSDVPYDDCVRDCGTDGSGAAMCDAHDMGLPHTPDWGPSFRHSWGATAVLPGRFGMNAVSPTDDLALYDYAWVTVGGDNTESGDWQKTAEADIESVGAKGCAFDEEGGVSAKTAQPWVLQMRAKHPAWTFVYVPQCGLPIMAYDPAAGGCDFIAPMMYYSNEGSYPGMDITQGSGNSADCIAQIQKAGWPAVKTVLTFQSYDAYRVSEHGSASASAAAASSNSNATAAAVAAPSTRQQRPAMRGALLSGGGGGGSANSSSSSGGFRGAEACTGCIPGSSEGDGLLKTMGKLLTDYAITVTYWGTASVTLQGPFAGVLGWPSQCGGAMHRCWPAMDEKNIKIVVNAAGRSANDDEA